MLPWPGQAGARRSSRSGTWSRSLSRYGVIVCVTGGLIPTHRLRSFPLGFATGWGATDPDKYVSEGMLRVMMSTT